MAALQHGLPVGLINASAPGVPGTHMMTQVMATMPSMQGLQDLDRIRWQQPPGHVGQLVMPLANEVLAPEGLLPKALPDQGMLHAYPPVGLVPKAPLLVPHSVLGAPPPPLQPYGLLPKSFPPNLLLSPVPGWRPGSEFVHTQLQNGALPMRPPLVPAATLPHKSPPVKAPFGSSLTPRVLPESEADPPWRRKWRRRIPPPESSLSSGTGGLSPGPKPVPPRPPTETASPLTIDEYRKRLLAIYALHKPENVLKVDYLLEKYRGREELLYQSVCLKCGADPDNCEALLQRAAPIMSMMAATAQAAARQGDQVRPPPPPPAPPWTSPSCGGQTPSNLVAVPSETEPRDSEVVSHASDSSVDMATVDLLLLGEQASVDVTDESDRPRLAPEVQLMDEEHLSDDGPVEGSDTEASDNEVADALAACDIKKSRTDEGLVVATDAYTDLGDDAMPEAAEVLAGILNGRPEADGAPGQDLFSGVPSPERAPQIANAKDGLAHVPQSGSHGTAPQVRESSSKSESSSDSSSSDSDAGGPPRATELAAPAHVQPAAEPARESLPEVSAPHGKKRAASVSADPPVVKDSKKDGPARAGVAHVPKAATTSEEAGRGKQVSRTAMVHTIFQVLDEGNTGLLGSKAMRRFAVLNGFEGSVADWEAEFRMICGEWGISGDGFGEASFQQLVNDESEKGCFCNNQEL